MPGRRDAKRKRRRPGNRLLQTKQVQQRSEPGARALRGAEEDLGTDASASMGCCVAWGRGAAGMGGPCPERGQSGFPECY